MSKANAFQSMRVFVAVWAGQLVSLAGSSLSTFALGVWVYQRTNSVTLFALISVFAVVPSLLALSVAGALVDRWDRRRVMIVGDTGSAVCTLLIALLIWLSLFNIVLLYLIVAVKSVFEAVQRPAYSASITMLVPREQLARANGMVQLGIAVAQIVAPLLGSVLLSLVQIYGVLLIDLATSVFALAVLLLVRFPRPAKGRADDAERSLFGEAAYGWTYITARPGLLGLTCLFFFTNLIFGIVSVLVTPLLLTMTSAKGLGTVLTIGGTGMLAGSLLMSTWGGPRRRIQGVLCAILVEGVAILSSGLSPSVVLIAVAAFAFFLAVPVDNGCTRTIVQSKVAPEVQGRVFAVIQIITFSSLPLGYLMAGPLVERVFQPLIDGRLADSVGRIIGVGPGRGIGLLFIFIGLLMMLTALAGYLYPRLRMVEQELPDALITEAPAALEATD